MPQPAFRQRKRTASFAKYKIVLAYLLLANVVLLSEQVAHSQSSEGTIHGIVKSGNMPIPGVTVTATNESTKEKTTTWTNVDGTYLLRVHSFGRFVISAQMIAFAPLKQEVTLNANASEAIIHLELILE